MWEFFAECVPVSRPKKSVGQFVLGGGVEEKLQLEQLRHAAAVGVPEKSPNLICVVQIFCFRCQLCG